MEWRAVVGFEDTYEISSIGAVRRIGKARGATVGRHLKTTKPGWGGYPVVTLTRKGEMYKAFIHRLVATAFLGLCPVGYEVNHKDLNRTNPAVENLEYLTRKGNMDHARAAGRLRVTSGEERSNHKLTLRQVREIRTAHETHRALGERYGVTHSIIGRIKRGEDWPEVERVLKGET